MKITQVIEKLEILRELYGDLQVNVAVNELCVDVVNSIEVKEVIGDKPTAAAVVMRSKTEFKQ